MDKAVIVAYVSEVRANRAGDRSEKVTISADYESANILSSLTFQVPIAQAKQFFVGQPITINVNW